MSMPVCVFCGKPIHAEELYKTNVADFHKKCYKIFVAKVEYVLAKRRKEKLGKSYVTRKHIKRREK